MHQNATRQRPPTGGSRPGPLPARLRMRLRVAQRQPLCKVAVERGIEVPADDGVTLLTDHYIPLAPGPHPTLLVRTPDGRGMPWDFQYGALFAEQGFHVVIQSCRGTGGSTGTLEPFVGEAADAQATVAWLRRQEWFNGALGTLGLGYLGYTQWALAADPPPELRAMVIQTSTDDFREVIHPGGAFALEANLISVASSLFLGRSLAAFALAMMRLRRRLPRVARTLPLIDAYPSALGGRVGFFEEWMTHTEPDDPYWARRRAAVTPELVPPTNLLTGWSDITLDQTLELHRRLCAAGRQTRLVIGPWTHSSGFSRSDFPVIFAETLKWLTRHLGSEGTVPGDSAPVRVHVSEVGAPGTWRDLAAWPPAGFRDQQWYLHDDGTAAPALPATQAVSRFRYDPADPTPSVGGPRTDAIGAGPRPNNALESRPDVLVFTSAPLTDPLEVIGSVSLRVQARGSSPHFDIFARLCDVDTKDTSWNVCDGLIRLAASPAPGDWHHVTVPMSATAHRFPAGHRLRIQVSAGAHPRYARNTGSGEPPATATRLIPVDIQITDGQLLVPTAEDAAVPPQHSGSEDDAG
jgi:putative CocE/NonD family hydrolase